MGISEEFQPSIVLSQLAVYSSWCGISPPTTHVTLQDIHRSNAGETCIWIPIDPPRYMAWCALK